MIHQYKLGDYNIVLDICSGSVHAVDDVAYDIIEIFENNSRETVIETIKNKHLGTDGITETDIIECYEQIEQLETPCIAHPAAVAHVGKPQRNEQRGVGGIKYIGETISERECDDAEL